MAKFCSEDCERQGAICDFCKFYDFNGDEDGAYTDEGWCNKFSKQKDPEEGWNCDEFICSRVGKDDQI